MGIFEIISQYIHLIKESIEKVAKKIPKYTEWWCKGNSNDCTLFVDL